MIGRKIDAPPRRQQIPETSFPREFAGKCTIPGGLDHRSRRREGAHFCQPTSDVYAHILSSPKRNIAYGYGIHLLQRFGKKVWGHGGSHWGYRSHMEYYPEEEFGLVILSNYGFQEVFGIADALGTLWFGQEVPYPKKAEPWAGKHSAIQPFLGTYQKDGHEARFLVDQGQYFLQLPHGRQWIFPTKPGEFAHAFLDESYAIKETEAGLEFWGMKQQ